MSQLQLVTNIAVRGVMERAGLRSKVPGTHPFFTPNKFSQSLQSQKFQIQSPQKVYHSTSAE